MRRLFKVNNKDSMITIRDRLQIPPLILSELKRNNFYPPLQSSGKHNILIY